MNVKLASLRLIALSGVVFLTFGPPAGAQLPTGTSPIAQQEPEVREQAGNVLFVRPVGWKRQNNPDGTVTLIPPGLPHGREVGLLIMQGGEVPPGTNLRAWFDFAWQALLQANQARVVSGGEAHARRADGFDVVSTAATFQSAAGKRTYVNLFVAAPGTRTETVLFAADGEDLYQKYVGAVSKLWETVRFANLQPGGQSVAGPAPPSAPSAPGQGQLQVESMYLSYKRGAGLSGWGDLYSFDHLTFYTNGLVYWGSPSVEGPGATDLTTKAPGTYRVVGDEVRVTWRSGETSVYRRRGEKMEAAGKTWWRLPKMDGLRLQGTYVKPGTADPTWITFAPDGTFRDAGVVKLAGALAFMERQLDPPPGGSGTYTIRDYSLTLTYTYGVTARMMFYVLPDDNLKRPKQLLLNTYFFELQGGK